MYQSVLRSKTISFILQNNIYKEIQKEEAIKIGDDITVRVLGIQGGNVKLGIEAPKSTDVHREEIYKKIQKEKEEV